MGKRKVKKSRKNIITYPFEAVNNSAKIYAWIQAVFLSPFLLVFLYATAKLLFQGIESINIGWMSYLNFASLIAVVSVFAVYSIMRVKKEVEPVEIQFNTNNLAYDSGIPPMKVELNILVVSNWLKQVLRKRVMTEFTLEEIKTIALRERKNQVILTIVKEKRELEILFGVSNQNKRAFYQQLNKKYKIS